MVNDGRTTTGKPSSAVAFSQSPIEWHTKLRATSPPIFSTMALNVSRFSPRWIASKLAPIISTPYFSRTPFSCSAIAVLSAVWPPSVGSTASIG